MSNTAVTPKASWVGNIGLGPFQVPIKMMPMARESGVEFNGVIERQVAKKEGRKTVTETVIDKVRMQFVDGDGNVVSREETKKGYDLGNGQWVVFEKDEIESMQAEQDKKLNVQCFVDAASIDPSLVQKSYHLWPGKNGLAEYRLFMDALAPVKRGDVEKAAVVKFVNRTVQHLAVIRRRGDLMVLDVVCWHSQVVDCNDVARQVAAVKSDATHLNVARTIVTNMMGTFEHASYPDEVTQRMEAAITERAAQEAISVLDGYKQQAAPRIEDALEAMVAASKGKPKGKTQVA